MLALKNVGKSFITSIVNERERNGKFTSFDDFVYRLKDTDINKRQVEALIKAGAFDSLGKKRSQLFYIYEKALENAISISKTTANGQIDITQLFSEEELSETLPKIEYPDVSEFPTKELLLFEKEILGMCFSGKILDSYSKHLSDLKPMSISNIINNDDLVEKSTVKIAGIIVSRSIK